jgi:hypothetical protein
MECFLKYKIIFSILLSLLIISCGGGGEEGNSPKPSPVINTAPIISKTTSIRDSSGNNIIETYEVFEIVLKISDQENDVINGTITIEENIAELTDYIGEEDYSHQARFSISTKGERTAVISISDGNENNVSESYPISVVPNESEIQASLSTDIVDFVAGGEFNGVSLLGSVTDESDITVGYLSIPLNEEQINYNATPYGECANSTPHKLISVEVTASDLTIPKVGLLFPLECLSSSQQTKILKKKKVQISPNNSNPLAINYIAQNFAIIIDESDTITINKTGKGISIEGIAEDILCDDFTLSKENNTYSLTNEQILAKVDTLFAESQNFILTCQRVVIFENEVKVSPLLATITGELTEIDNTFPTGSVDDISFSIPFLEGGVDQGNICAKTTANDNKNILTEILTLHASDGLVESVVMAFNEDNRQYCASLLGFDGSVHISQTIIDVAANVTTNTSSTYSIKKNEPPIFDETLSSNITLEFNQGIVVLVNAENVSDPENQEITLSGETSFNTEQALGTYEITIIASDPYNAQTTKTIEINLTNNTPPIAQIMLSGDYLLLNGAIRDINNNITLELSSSDEGGQVFSSILATSLNSEDYEEITNYSSIYIHNILLEGGNSRLFNYQVTDNSGLQSNIASLNMNIHLNNPPIYTGELSYTSKRGECITVEQKASDNENDLFSFAIQEDAWMICTENVESMERLITIEDEYGASTSVTITANFTDCPSNEVWTGSLCRLPESIPDPFTFGERDNATFNTIYGSKIVTITGLESRVTVSITGGRYSINDFASDENDLEKYTSANGTIKNGDQIHVIQTSSANERTTTIASVTIGSGTGDFKVTTDSLAPEVSIGQDRNFKSGEKAEGVAVIPSGIDNSLLVSYSWSQISGPRTLDISQSEKLMYGTYSYPISFTAPVVTQAEEYIFRFTATNNAGFSGHDEWKVTILP